jgi:glycosyltransferase involved in cell wall biosynthesis
MSHTIRHIVAIVPARNEERLLPRCLRSLELARGRLPAHVTSDVVVVVDRSFDRTFAVAAAILGTAGLVLAVDAGSVGVARSIGAALAEERSTYSAPHCWLANTDADCEVPPTWLQDQVNLASRGVEAVAGVIDVDDFGEHGPHVEESFRSSYTLHADGTHPHVHGANLGVRLDVYSRAGGWAPLAHAEDHDLWRRLRDHGAELVADASLVVRTSGRRVGRAPCGFAGALAAHNGRLPATG